MRWRIPCVIIVLYHCMGAGYGQNAKYLVGAGIADITGPAADVPLMGYAKPDQDARGIHLRLYSRAFITCHLNNTNCAVFVNMDIGMGSAAINLKVFEILRANGWEDRYNERNVAISATHTHSGPGGYFQYFLFTVVTAGFHQDTFDIIVEGIVKSIERAHNKLTPGHIYLNDGELLKTSINRSPTAYTNNPWKERNKYKHDTDKSMTIVKFVDVDGKDIGVISWFPVHPVSMNNSNHLISSDNKGYASYLFEQHMNNGAPMGQGDFVAAFANANHGDTSPNIKGPKCIDTGFSCRPESSTCDGRSQLCIAFGPGDDMFESTRIIGENQYLKAKELYEDAIDELDGPIGAIYQYVNMTSYPVKINHTYTATTCSPAMGYSFAAGCIDGAGFGGFTQGDTEGSDLWDAIRDLIKEPSEEMIKCQKPKPVLLPIGEMLTPWQWAPAIVQTQILRIGQLVINMVPGEFSTMSGRRLKESINEMIPLFTNKYTGLRLQIFVENGVPNACTMLTGLSNTYTDYVTTFEEYQDQRYEAASTIYGQHTLQAYIQQYTMLAEHLVQGNLVDPGPAPENLLEKQKSYLDPPPADSTPPGVTFGDVYIDTDHRYRQGGVASATFWAGNLRHDAKAMVESTFLSVEIQISGTWKELYNDADWSTRFSWEKKVVTENSTQSLATVRFEIPDDAPLRMYRIRHQGFYKNDQGSVFQYEGFSSPFEVIYRTYKRGVQTTTPFPQTPSTTSLPQTPSVTWVTEETTAETTGEYVF